MKHVVVNFLRKESALIWSITHSKLEFVCIECMCLQVSRNIGNVHLFVYLCVCVHVLVVCVYVLVSETVIVYNKFCSTDQYRFIFILSPRYCWDINY